MVQESQMAEQCSTGLSSQELRGTERHTVGISENRERPAETTSMTAHQHMLSGGRWLPQYAS